MIIFLMQPEKKIELDTEVKDLNEEQLKKLNDQKKKEVIKKFVQANHEKDQRKIKYYKQLTREHRFWDSQPTLRDDRYQEKSGNVEGQRKVSDVRKEPLDLPEGMYWCQIDIKGQKDLEDLYVLLTNNYVEDEDNTFRFDYSREFLRWALTPPGYQPKWLVGVRDEKSNELIASITGVPVHVHIEEEDKIKMCQINFLCVHKAIRAKNMAATLIAQVTRRVNLKNKWQAIYTSGKVLPTPFTQAIYYHRSINPKKLIQIGFSGLPRTQTMAMNKKLYMLPEAPTLEGLRPMNKKDVPGLTKLINDGLSKFLVRFLYTEEEVKHYFMPRQGVVYTYVIDEVIKQDDKKKINITDVLSFYSLPSHVMKHDKHNMLYACYSFMNFATKVPYDELIRNALILAKIHKYDVYNCLNLMDNSEVFEKLNFQKGDGHLNYYFYNWIMKRKHIEPKQLGVVLF